MDTGKEPIVPGVFVESIARDILSIHPLRKRQAATGRSAVSYGILAVNSKG